MPAQNPGRRFKNAIYEQFGRVGKALASPHRIELVELLSQGPRTVEALARMADLSLANASQHLQVLRAAGLLEATKEGLFVTYRLADPSVADLLLALRKVAETRLAEVAKVSREFLAENAQLEEVDEEALRRRVRKGEVTVLDVRPPEEYEAGHIPGALSVPLPELAKRLTDLPKRREVVAYCRGPYCVLAIEAVKLLRARGFKAVRLEDGVLDWAALGLKVEASRGMSGTTPLEYAPWRGTALGTVTERLERDAVLELAGPLAAREVLDVGCGDGVRPRRRPAGAHVRSGGSIACCGRGGAPQRDGRRRAGRGARGRRAIALPFPAERFDVVVAVTISASSRHPGERSRSWHASSAPEARPAPAS